MESMNPPSPVNPPAPPAVMPVIRPVAPPWDPRCRLRRPRHSHCEAGCAGRRFGRSQHAAPGSHRKTGDCRHGRHASASRSRGKARRGRDRYDPAATFAGG